MNIELIGYLGDIRNDTGILGKSFIFKLITENINEEFIFFIHPNENVKPFITIDYELTNEQKTEIVNNIINKYTKDTLLNYANN